MRPGRIGDWPRLSLFSLSPAGCEDVVVFGYSGHCCPRIHQHTGQSVKIDLLVVPFAAMLTFRVVCWILHLSL